MLESFKMLKTRPIIESFRKFGAKHTLFRGFEYVLLQTAPTARIYWSLAPKYYHLKRGRSLKKYGIAAPFEPVWVSPGSVSRFSARGRISDGVLNDIGRVIDGEWDRKRREQDEIGQYAPTLEETVLFRGMKAHFHHDIDWEQTEIYERIRSAVIDRDVRYHGCETVEDVNEHFTHIDKVYRSIQQNGYKLRRELRDPKPSIEEPFGYINERIMETSVDIGRDGEFLLVDGRHRLAIAKLLDLDEIPVTVIVRHKEWLEQTDDPF